MEGGRRHSLPLSSLPLSLSLSPSLPTSLPPLHPHFLPPPPPRSLLPLTLPLPPSLPPLCHSLPLSSLTADSSDTVVFVDSGAALSSGLVPKSHSTSHRTGTEERRRRGRCNHGLVEYLYIQVGVITCMHMPSVYMYLHCTCTQCTIVCSINFEKSVTFLHCENFDHSIF